MNTWHFCGEMFALCTTLAAAALLAPLGSAVAPLSTRLAVTARSPAIRASTQGEWAPGQDETPLVDALRDASRGVRAPFFFPGHKLGSGAPGRLRQLLGRRFLAHDLPEEIGRLDSLFAPEDALLRAQQLAARAFGARRTWFLCNGSTCGVIAAVLACVQTWTRGRPPERSSAPVVLLPRNAHKSALHALVASGAEPCWLLPEYDSTSGLCLGVTPAAVAEGLAAHADRAAAVLIVSPTYQGVLSDVASAASLCGAARVPLIVDEAHGGHLEFLPQDRQESELLDGSSAQAPLPRPRGALHEGADLVVQSTHKTLGSLTQTAMLHASSAALDNYAGLGKAVSSSLETVQSSSPSYLLLASLDAARWQVASRRGGGRQMLARAVSHADALRAGVGALRDAGGDVATWVAPVAPLSGHEGVHALDPLRVTLVCDVAPGDEGGGGDEAESVNRDGGGGDGSGGFGLSDYLEADGIYAELEDARTLTLALSAGTRRRDVRRLLRALRRRRKPVVVAEGTSASSGGGGEGPLSARAVADVAAAAGGAGAARARHWGSGEASGRDGGRGLSPREASLRARRTVAAADAVGELSADLVCPYPPGIPLLVPGEVITAAALQELRALADAGCAIVGADPALREFAVLV